MNRILPPPVSDELALCLRAYAKPNASPKKAIKLDHSNSKIPILPASEWTIVFDTETTVDAGQSLRFGTYQVRQFKELREAGIFFDPAGVTTTELECLKQYAARREMRLISVQEFNDEIIFRIGWELRARIVGFNLPFDISRIAIKHSSARTSMRGGFSFTLSTHKIYPHIQVRHLSQRMAFIRFAGTKRQKDSRGMRNRGQEIPQREGHFVDVKTLAGALFERSFSLSGLSKFLKVENPKLEFDEFDGPVTDQMIEYAVRDVQTTWECYVELIARLDQLELPELAAEKVYSAASIGKGYLRQMGIKPWQKCQPDFPPQMIANILGSYFGGRSEIRIRREMRQVILCDFLSMYPTVCTLMGLWRFVIADGMTARDSTIEAKPFLANVDVPALQSQETWKNLTTLVWVLPDGDIFPVRASYMDETQSTIGLNYLTSDKPLCFTMADCVASKLLTGKAPKVVKAVTFEPNAIQPDLRPVNISGNPDYRVDPNDADFFRRVIELRQSVKLLRDLADGDERDALDTEQNALKIAANSTAYGVYVEVNVATKASPFDTIVHNALDEPFTVRTDKAEEPGAFFHPLLAAMITGAARLMLAATERLVSDKGLDWSFCDTDSMAIAKPDNMEAIQFRNYVSEIVDWFAPLNPYEFGGSILKIEDVNFGLETGHPLPLYCWAISSKRYALFNLCSKNTPIMRKVSAHGLGHLLSPYEPENAPTKIPSPHKSVLKDGTKRWHSDLWYQIVVAALNGNPNQVPLNYHPSLWQPAISRYGATSPELLNWFRHFNFGKPYRAQVKPFGFLLSLSTKTNLRAERLSLAGAKSRRRKLKPIKPITTFDRDFNKAVRKAFDRESGAVVPASSLKTYAEALSSYHLQPESKFLNGDYYDQGTTERRHVRTISCQHIGKESNNWERQAILGFDPDAAPDYGMSPKEIATVPARLTVLAKAMGSINLAHRLRISIRILTQLKSARGNWADIALKIAPELILKLERDAKSAHDRKRDELVKLSETVDFEGWRATARKMQIDPSNLRRRLKMAGYKANLDK